ncbi:MAG: hypothetical protein R3D32_02670 [Nitratireductor sp.]
MRVLMVLAVVADLLLATLMVAVSGFILEGVNGQGPLTPVAYLYVGFILVCLAATAATIALRNRPALATVIAAAPLAIAALALLLEGMVV